MTKTLNKIEIDIVTDVLIRGDYETLDIASFNHAVSNSLPTWRAEHVVGSENNIAYVEYVKEILTSYKEV
jgi:hypothetical protein